MVWYGGGGVVWYGGGGCEEWFGMVVVVGDGCDGGSRWLCWL